MVRPSSVPATLLLVVGLLAVLPPTANAAVTCSYDEAAHKLLVTATANAVTIRRSGPSILVIKDGIVDCSGPGATVTNTDTVEFDVDESSAAVRIDQSGGPFVPGYADEGTDSEIEIAVHTGPATGRFVSVTGGDAGERIRAGSTGGQVRVNLNAGEASPDVDITADRLRFLDLNGGAGDDLIDARGGAGTGFALGFPLLARGGGGADTLYGGSGASDLRSGGGTGDVLVGGPADDFLGLEGGSATIDGGGGSHDALQFTGTGGRGVTVDLAVAGPQDTRRGIATITGIEEVLGTLWPDVLRGTDEADRLAGSSGNDRLDGRGGDDVLDGGGATVCDAVPHPWAATYGECGDVVDYSGAAGPVTVDLATSAPQSTVGAGQDTLEGVEGVIGSPFADHLAGDARNNRLWGLAGADTLDGGSGADTLWPGDGPGGASDGAADDVDGGPGNDQLSYEGRRTRVAIRLDDQRNEGADPNGDGVSTGSEEGDLARNVENGKGGGGRDRFRAFGEGVNRFVGGAGDDWFDGALGADVFDGLAGLDAISYASRTHPVAVAAPVGDRRRGGADPNGDGVSSASEEGDLLISAEVVYGGSGPDKLVGGLRLFGGRGSDLLDSRDGRAGDRLDCGADADAYRADDGDSVTACEAPAP